MAKLEDIRARSTWAQLIEGQPQHLAIAMLMALGAVSLLATDQDAPRLLGLSAWGWGLVSICLALLHQIIVAVVFRLQLYRNMMTKLFGARDLKIWGMIFMPLLLARPLTVIMIGWADATPITGYRSVETVLGLALLAAAIWVLHSVLVHFTIPRALGGDHFRDSYAEMPLVRKGAFRFSANAMYGLAFLGLWGIALLFGSWNALVVALFQHAYIWVHMYCTETPDMVRIYTADTLAVPDAQELDAVNVADKADEGNVAVEGHEAGEDKHAPVREIADETRDASDLNIAKILSDA